MYFKWQNKLMKMEFKIDIFLNHSKASLKFSYRSFWNTNFEFMRNVNENVSVSQFYVPLHSVNKDRLVNINKTKNISMNLKKK